MNRLIQVALIAITPEVLQYVTSVEIKANGVSTTYARNIGATPTDVLFGAWLVQKCAQHGEAIGKTGPGLVSIACNGVKDIAGVKLLFSNKEAETLPLTEFSLGKLLIERDLQVIEKRVLKTVLSFTPPAKADVVISAAPRLLMS